MITAAGYEMHRANIACEEWKKYRMQDVSPAYLCMLPPSCDAKVLLEAEAAIRRMIERDAKAYLETPFRQPGPTPQMVDWTNVSPQDRMGVGFEAVPMLGMPGIVRKGHENDPAVLAAIEKAQQGPEYAKAAKRRELSDAHRTAMEALNQGGVDRKDRETMDRLYAEYRKAWRALMLFDGREARELDALDATQAAYRALDRAREAARDADGGRGNRGRQCA